jgi:hypothetical protein|nr:MAG TPA: hypothetical protein [Caudoviricetes sp.]
MNKDNKYTNDYKKLEKRKILSEINMFISIVNVLVSGLNAFIFHNEILTYICVVLLITTITTFGYLIVTE